MKKIPVVVDTDIFLRHVEKDTIRATCKILGARHGEFLIIEDPVIRINDRIVGRIEGEAFCYFIVEGDIYRFQSRVLKTLEEGITLLEYPVDVEVRTMRRHPRIQVNIETRLEIESVRGTLDATIVDISEGGCYLTINTLTVIAASAGCKMDFTLVTGENVRDLQGVVRRIQHSAVKKETSIGVEFTGPDSEIWKIVSFCRFCLYFRI